MKKSEEIVYFTKGGFAAFYTIVVVVSGSIVLLVSKYFPNLF
jgi:hypothetical protein